MSDDTRTASWVNYFIENECYLQNRPLTTKDFIKEAKKRNIEVNESTLENLEHKQLLLPILRLNRPIGTEERVKFEKNGKTFYKRKEFKLEDDEKFIEEYSVQYYSSYGFLEHDKDLLSNWINEGLLFEPSSRKFQEWENFTGEELENGKEKTITFYSIFQLYWLEVLKNNLTITIDFLGSKPVLRTSQSVQVGRYIHRGNYSINDTSQISPKLEELSQDDRWKDLFNLEDKQAELEAQYQKFNHVLKSLLLIQSVYYPYVKSGRKTIQLNVSDEKWKELKQKVDLKEILRVTNIDKEMLVYWYKVLTEKAEDILGEHNYDWFQLWKNISWSKKEKLKGKVRLGIDYLQWAIMLKKIIEDFVEREIPDIDELSSYASEDLLKIDLDRWNGAFNPRHYRNLRNFDMPSSAYDELNEILKQIQSKSTDKKEIEARFKKYEELGFYIDWDKEGIYIDREKATSLDYWKNKYKRLYYLSNSFGIDYQPKITVFVEGATEATVLPKLLAWYYSKPEDLGIDFINIGGVDSLFGAEFNLKDQFDQKPEKKLISNFKSLITYNLDRWQIIPFLATDDEGNLLKLLDSGLIARINNQDISIDKESELVYVWGVTNKNIPLKGDSFELANFTDEELAKSISNVISESITSNDIKTARDSGVGINNICNGKYKNEVSGENKVAIGVDLINNLFDYFAKNNDESIFERPMFKMLNIVIKNAALNHQPVDRVSEIKNKEILVDIIKNAKKDEK